MVDRPRVPTVDARPPIPDKITLPKLASDDDANRGRRRSAHARAVDDLGIAIVSGQFPTGEPLPIEPDLGDWLGASRTVVREATKVLASKGLLHSRPRIGTVVLPRPMWDVLDSDVLRWMIDHGKRDEVIIDVTEVRLIIEPAAARLAAERRTATEADELAQLVDTMAESVEVEQQYVAADLAFHAAILGATRNAMLVRFVSAIEIALGTSRELSVHAPGGPAGAMDEHRAVADAIIGADPEAAGHAMTALIRLTQSHLDYVIKHDG